MKRYVTCYGTATETVADTLALLGGKLHVVETLAQAERAKPTGLILLGGADINPKFYGERNRYSRFAETARDTLEWYLVHQAIAARMPILGICRGHQMIAAACGGSLYQDLHRDGATQDHPSRHLIGKVIPPLAAHLPSNIGGRKAGTYNVNSLHHQAVRRAPFGFSVAALATDGIIEAIWRPGVLGVQWHPEILISSNENWIKLFAWFVDGGLK